MLKFAPQCIVLSLFLSVVAGCEQKEAGPATGTRSTSPEHAVTHRNFVIITESAEARAAVTLALSSACGQLPGGKPSDPEQLRQAEQAENNVVIEYITARYNYSQMSLAPHLEPQALLFVAGMADGVIL